MRCVGFIEIADTEARKAARQHVRAVPFALHPALHHLVGALLALRDILAERATGEASRASAIEQRLAVWRFVREEVALHHVARVPAGGDSKVVVGHQGS